VELQGQFLCSDGRYSEAKTLLHEILENNEKTREQNHLETLTSLASLACTYQCQRRWMAVEMQVQVMETKKSVLGLKHRNALTSITNLTSILVIGATNGAEKLEVQVMETMEAVLGPEHPSTLTNMDNLAY
jgi:Tetratricopeptide repeat